MKHILVPLIAVVLLAQTPAASALEYTARVLGSYGAPRPYGVPGYMGWGIATDSQVGVANIGANDTPVLWIDDVADPIVLQPAGYDYGTAFGADGNSQVGYSQGPASGHRPHALLWNGSAESYVDLHPDGYLGSQAFAVAGPAQVGTAWPGSEFEPHAALWNGSAESFVDLHLDGWEWSRALGISGNRQFGNVGGAPGSHAIIWNGTKESFVDLHPAGFSHTWGTAIDGDTQVGLGAGTATGGKTHALMWSGTAASVVDLHPAGFQSSEAYAVSGDLQVGSGQAGSNEFALLWSGSSGSAVNLHQYLDSLGGTFYSSRAVGINSQGEIIGHATDETGEWRAVVWSPVVPEPSTFLLAIGVLLLSGNRSHRRRSIR